MDCRSACAGPSGDLQEHRQAEHNCTLPGFDVSLHRLKTREDSEYAGFLYPAFRADVEREQHDWVSMGCPKSWDLCGWTRSVARFLRRRVEGGSRVPNPFLDRTDDELIIEAVLEYERAQDLVWNEYYRMIKDR